MKFRKEFCGIKESQRVLMFAAFEASDEDQGVLINFKAIPQ
jgi:hypothetical protein